MLKRIASPLIIGCALLASVCARADDKPTVTVTIIATVPKDTPKDAKVYLAGNLDEVGAWKADGKLMKRTDEGKYTITLKLPKGQTLEYKLNCGSWDTVEKSDKGQEIDNRKLEIDADKEEKITVGSWRDKSKETPEAPPKPTTTGDIRYHDNFASKNLANTRRLIVWLPPGYEANKEQRYPVLYLHDGQNVFDATTSFAGEWKADETATELIEKHEIPLIIMVAVENAGASRIDEYTPTSDAAHGGAGGKGELYAKFLIEEVKPFIDSNYRTLTDRSHTSVGGSSLGGLISLYLAYQHPEVFSSAAVMSPALWWDDHRLTKEIAADPAPLKQARLWIDIGTDEGAMGDAKRNVDDVREFATVLQHAGMSEGKDYSVKIVEGAQHNEAAWSARFGEVLKFLFPKP
jgi:predicted alpha/beta superfamily hydrolase